MKSLIYFIVALLLLASCQKGERKAATDQGDPHSHWETYAGTRDGIRYSSCTQIDTSNVGELAVAWRYSTGDRDSLNRSQNQCNPIVVDGVLYGVSPTLKLFALDAGTGKERWVFDPFTWDRTHGHSTGDRPMAYYMVSRGVAFWQSRNGRDQRIFHNVGGRLFCIDARNGKPIEEFGKGGFILFSEDLDRDAESGSLFVVNSTPGIVYKDLLITGTRVSESADAAPGHVRAYSVKTGKRKWIFHTIPHPGEAGYETWPDPEAYRKLGGANSWAGMSLDKERGIVYVPTGTVSGDFYGGIREGQDLFGNCLIALDAATGNYLWHYQVIHHDLWDRDLPANPNLFTFRSGGKEVEAVAQITKHGYVFLFNRLTGEPIYPIDEVPVPMDALPGEKPWPTQPKPRLPEPFARQHFGEDEISDLSPETHRIMLERFRQIRYTEPFTPPSLEGSWIFPGFDGGGEWGGAALDPETQVLYVNSSELPYSMVMIEVPRGGDETGIPAGQAVYNRYCIACHGVDMKGSTAAFPSLVDIDSKYAEEEIREIIKGGRNMMPSFGNLSGGETEALIELLTHSGTVPSTEPDRTGSRGMEETGEHENSIMDQVPYVMTGYNRFLDDQGYPGIKPPWGTLNAVDLASGKLLWKVPLGEYPELMEKGIPPTGTETYGGPVVTRGGLVFIAATKDSRIRAFDKKTGKVLWQHELPACGFATPAVYYFRGKEYLVIACGGGKTGSPSGDEFVAFALPDIKN